MPRATIKLVSYWTTPVAPIQNGTGDRGTFIRHTSPADAAYIAGCQANREVTGPSSCVWMVPGVEEHD